MNATQKGGAGSEDTILARQRAITVCRALQHPVRWDIVEILCNCPGGLTPQALNDRLNLPKSTLGTHLAELRSAGIVKVIGRRTNARYEVAESDPYGGPPPVVETGQMLQALTAVR